MKRTAIAISFVLMALMSNACWAMIPMVPRVPARLPAALTPSLQQNQSAPIAPKSISNDELNLAIFAKLGDVCFEAGNYEAAVRFYAQALSYLDRKDPTKLRQCSGITGSLSICFFALGDATSAEKYSRMSLNCALNAKPRDAVDISISYNNLAYLNKMVRKYSQAEKLYESAIASAPRTSSEDRIRAATIEANLAELYELNGKLSRAAAAYQHSLDVLENELSSEHAAVKELKQLIQQFVLRHGIR